LFQCHIIILFYLCPLMKIEAPCVRYGRGRRIRIDVDVVVVVVVVVACAIERVESCFAGDAMEWASTRATAATAA
jgi:hypothetical protein